MNAAHAIAADLDAYLSPASAALVDPDDVDRQLLRASDLVDDLTGRANYSVDGNGNATDPDIAEALKLATCAVIELWLEVGEENDIDGLAAEQISVTGFSGRRAPEATKRVLRPLRRVNLLCQPGQVINGELVWP